MLSRLFLPLFFCCLASSHTAQADPQERSLSVLQVRAEPGVPQTAVESVQQALARATHSLRVVHHREDEIIEPGKACDQPTCLQELLGQDDTQAALVVSLFQDDTTTSATVVLLEAPRWRYYEALVVTKDFASKLEPAVRRLVDAWQRGPGPWLEVTTQPNHATVSVDGEVVGIAPYRGVIAAGHHVLAVSAPDFVPYSAAIAVQGHANNVLRRQVQLEPALAGTAPSSDAHTLRKARWLTGVGSALLLVGLTYGTFASVAAARNGDCRSYAAEAGTRWCREYYDFSSSEWLGLSTAASAFAVGGVLSARGFWLLRVSERPDAPVSIAYRRSF